MYRHLGLVFFWKFSWIGRSSILIEGQVTILESIVICNICFNQCALHIFYFEILGTDRPSVRLVGGTSEGEGRVEVYFNNTWGTVCYHSWSKTDAEVVCRQLGLPYGNAHPVGPTLFGRGTGQIWLSYVDCGGSESFLDECLKSNYPWGRHNCDHSMDAGVVCTNGNGKTIISQKPTCGKQTTFNYINFKKTVKIKLDLQSVSLNLFVIECFNWLTPNYSAVVATIWLTGQHTHYAHDISWIKR